ncbi:hypothetical protein J2S25_001096 [Mesobacillus stamsii]|uniref:Uncharacterized protein n=1 Tax=Mesobacillus stamsii TaxID=225347 RepID=A0ABU0FU87_9BACI|nr:hypothetical protein [Mesobacillus stamsii]
MDGGNEGAVFNKKKLHGSMISGEINSVGFLQKGPAAQWTIVTTKENEPES